MQTRRQAFPAVAIVPGLGEHLIERLERLA
jgi:hypothetical protein